MIVVVNNKKRREYLNKEKQKSYKEVVEDKIK